jgi:hypothetical protein
MQRQDVDWPEQVDDKDAVDAFGYPRGLALDMETDGFRNNQGRRLWVPAFAVTTKRF